MRELLEEIRKVCSVYFEETALNFHFPSHSRVVISGDYLTKALDNYKDERREINVLHWFEDFWIYIEINQRIPEEKDYLLYFVSISIFQGNKEDDIKTQLFRAEWDNFENDNSVHPQPHWHIYPFKYENKIYEDFETFIGMIEEGNNQEQGFMEQISSASSKLIDIRNIHFAMNGKWSENKGCIQYVSDVNILINWLFGVIGHIKEQLLYVRN